MASSRLLLVLASAFGVSAIWSGSALEARDEGSVAQVVSKSNQIRHLVISTQRSGSTWLVSMLNSHPKIQNYGELCAPELVEDAAGMKMSTEVVEKVLNASRSAGDTFDLAALVNSNFEDVLDFVYEEPRDSNVNVVGFKWMLNQALMDNFNKSVEYLNENNVRVIILDRQNALRRSISTYDMQCSTNPVHVMEDDKKVAEDAADIPLNYIHRAIENSLAAEADYELLEQHLKNYLHVPYEALAANTDKWMAKIYKFIGVEHLKPDTDELQKIHDGAIDSLIKDWPDKKAELVKDPIIANKISKWENDEFSFLFAPSNMEVFVLENGMFMAQDRDFPDICYN